MSRFSAIAAVTFAFIGAPGHAIAAPPTMDRPAASTSDVVQALRSAGIPVGRVVVYARNTDPNGLLGRRGQYVAKVSWIDDRVKSEGFDGGTVELFASVEDRKKRAAYIRGVDLAYGTLIPHQYVYAEGRALLRVSGRLPRSAAQVYGDTLHTLAPLLAGPELVGPATVYVGTPTQFEAPSSAGGVETVEVESPPWPASYFDVVLGASRLQAGAFSITLPMTTVASQPLYFWTPDTKAWLVATAGGRVIAAKIVHVQYPAALLMSLVDGVTSAYATDTVDCLRAVDVVRGLVVGVIVNLHTLNIANLAAQSVCTSANSQIDGLVNLGAPNSLTGEATDALDNYNEPGVWSDAINEFVATGVLSPAVLQGLDAMPEHEYGAVESLVAVNSWRSRFQLSPLNAACLSAAQAGDLVTSLGCLLGR